MKPLEKHSRNELIQIIRVYNDKNIIKNYLNLNKKQLIELINKHIEFDDEGNVYPKKNVAKVIEYDEFIKKLQDRKDVKILSGEQELKLARARGRQRGKIAKIDDEIEGLNEELDNEPKLKKDKQFMKQFDDLNKIKATEKAKLKTINELFKKNEKLIEATKAKKETKPKAKSKAKQDELLAEVKRFQEWEKDEEDKFKEQKAKSKSSCTCFSFLMTISC